MFGFKYRKKESICHEEPDFPLFLLTLQLSSVASKISLNLLPTGGLSSSDVCQKVSRGGGPLMRSHPSFGPADMFIHSLKERKKKKSSTPRFRQFDNIPSLEKPCLEERTKAFELELTGRALGTLGALLGLGNTQLSKGLHLGKMEQYLLLMHSDDTPQLVPFLFEVGQRRD